MRVTTPLEAISASFARFGVAIVEHALTGADLAELACAFTAAQLPHEALH